MTDAAELIAAGPSATAYDILRTARAELWVTDLSASERFYVDLLGLVVSARTDDALYLRGWEERGHHSLVLRKADEAAAALLSFRMRSENDVDALYHHFARQGLEPQFVAEAGPGMGRAVRVGDAFGSPLEFFHEVTQFPTQLQRFDLHRGAPIMRLDHFNLQVADVERAVTFWQGLGFRCTEYIATDTTPERITGAWLRRKPSVHDVALTVGRGPRLHHIGLFVAEPAGVLRACDQLAAYGDAAAIERGPGRHGVSNAFFVYLRDPDGHRIELYACDYYTGDPDHRAVRWSVSDPRCRSFWGTKAPDSWYDEASPFVGSDGKLLDTTAADVDERSARSEVMT